MNFIQTLVIFFITLVSWGVFADSKVEDLEQFEIRSYSPQMVGVKDLVFEIRIDGMKDLLEKNLVVGKLSDFYYKVYWTYPNEFRIEVEGLPKGFKEVKDDLRQLIKGKLEFVIPEKFSEKLKSYKLTIEPIADGKLLKAIDETYTLAIPEFNVTFEKNGRLRLIETKMGMSSMKTELFHSPKSWSNNKFVLDKVISTNGVPGAQSVIANDLEYTAINGVGFPSKLVVKNTTEFTIPATNKTKAKIQKKDLVTTIKFSKYEVNTGKAGRFITEGQLK